MKLSIQVRYRYIDEDLVIRYAESREEAEDGDVDGVCDVVFTVYDEAEDVVERGVVADCYSEADAVRVLRALEAAEVQ